MKKERFALACALVLLTTSMPSLASPDDLLERGRYLVKIAGCNDCHTAGYSVQAGQVPEEKWLTGDSFGWRGGVGHHLCHQPADEPAGIHGGAVAGLCEEPQDPPRRCPGSCSTR